MATTEEEDEAVTEVRMAPTDLLKAAMGSP